jgi:hypothetical protein
VQPDPPDNPRLKVVGRLGLPYVAVWRILSMYDRRFLKCHAGGATVKFNIGLSGKTEDVVVDGAVDAATRACLVEVTSRVEFPQPESVVGVQYTPPVEHTP